MTIRKKCTEWRFYKPIYWRQLLQGRDITTGRRFSPPVDDFYFVNCCPVILLCENPSRSKFLNVLRYILGCNIPSCESTISDFIAQLHRTTVAWWSCRKWQQIAQFSSVATSSQEIEHAQIFSHDKPRNPALWLVDALCLTNKME